MPMVVSPRFAERVIVLGAGASAHLGYPLGGSLLKAIRDSVEEPSELLTSALLHAKISEGSLEAFRHELDLTIVDSIDQFIEKNARFAEIARIMIAHELLGVEDRVRLSNSKSNWYHNLANLIVELLEGGRYPPVLLTFNYDLSLDEFLRSFPVPPNLLAPAETLADRVTLLHLHGNLGSVHKPEKGVEVRRYGQSVEVDQLIRVAAGLRTISELEHNYTPELMYAAQMIEKAQKVMFLGFAFDQWNLIRLRIDSGGRCQPWNVRGKFYGTAFKLDSKRRRELSAASDDLLELTAAGMDLQMFAEAGFLSWLKEPVVSLQKG